ncbi:MAG: Hsp20/alpha crystallin family protein [Desulfobacteraceae bacterium]|nr:Hsp20/alpha crystallin family protein [Desulfobacteraceae bacterium]
MFANLRDIDRMFGNMDLLQGKLDRLFNEVNRTRGYDRPSAVADSTPRTNLYDRGDNFEILAELPGFSKDDLNVKIQGNYLELKGTRKADAPEGYSSQRAERGATKFSRSFTLPSDVDATRVEAMLENGFLTLRLPKSEAAKPRQITIK